MRLVLDASAAVRMVMHAKGADGLLESVSAATARGRAEPLRERRSPTPCGNMPRPVSSMRKQRSSGTKRQSTWSMPSPPIGNSRRRSYPDQLVSIPQPPHPDAESTEGINPRDLTHRYGIITA